MKILSVRLDDEDQDKLKQIIARTKSSQTELIKRLINDQWVALQAGKTFLERRGDRPQHLLSAENNASDRDVRKALVAEHLARRRARRMKSN
jgi:hypothetical protein